MSKLVGNNEMAKLLRMSPQAFAKGIRQGRFTSSGKSERGKPLYNPEKVMREYKATIAMAETQDGAAMLPNELKGGRPSGIDIADNSKAYLKAKTANEALKAQLQKLKYESQSGKLIEKETARKQGAELGVRMMGIIDSWPARMAPEFAAMKNADEHDFHQKLSHEANILKQEIISICAVSQNKM